ncbi:MAG: hypothetical protein ABIR71_04775 [Chthoniobacterales bacterium]
MIAVTFALPNESSAFLALLQDPDRGRVAAQILSGTRHGHAVTVLHTGVGKETTQARLGEFLRTDTPALLISAGFAGALHDRWQAGEILFAENFSTANLDVAAQIDCRTGKLATAPEMVDAAAERAVLAAEGADAVDMETEFIAAACAAAGVPMISLRAISDTPGAPFPAPPHVLFDVKRQRTPFLPLFQHLLLRPAAIGRFVSFARQISSARQSLAQALDTLLRTGPL